jgi:hypothetical protein
MNEANTETNKPVSKARAIAFYLPQFHPIPENDEWWGPGFTEWVNVANARPLFKGHEQPKLPGELGFYDLRLPETRMAQAELAKMHGIEGFCYWHYWLGNGKRLLERPFDEVLSSGQPDFPFCLGWANHSWVGRFFGAKKRMLIEQMYPGMNDHKKHFEYLLKAFSDSRYITVDGKPLVYVFSPMAIPEPLKFTDYWRELALKSGLKGLHLIGQGIPLRLLKTYGFDAFTYGVSPLANEVNRLKKKFLIKIMRKPIVIDYAKLIDNWLPVGQAEIKGYPTILTNWDISPRYGLKGEIVINRNGENFRKHVNHVVNTVSHKHYEDRIVFIKSWNEWAEGNYLEPDRKDGRKYLEIIKDEILEAN